MDYMVVLPLILFKNFMFSRVALLIYIPTYSTKGFSFLLILARICYLLSFDNLHSNRCEVLTGGFDLHPPNA